MELRQFEVEFTRTGEVFNEQQVVAVLEALPALTDLFVVSHGWNKNVAEARDLYNRLLTSVSEVFDAGVVPDLNGRTFGVVRVFWPSKKFEDEELIPGGGAASATRENDTALHRVLDELKRDPVRLGGEERDPALAENVDRAQELVGLLETSSEARREFVFRLRSILNVSEAHADDGSLEFFTRDAEDLFQELSGPVIAPAGGGARGATSVHGRGGAADIAATTGTARTAGRSETTGTADTADVGGAAGLGDLLSGVKAAARRLANFTTYYKMKERSGVVGRGGVSQLLKRVRDRKGAVRLHLVGHSFGGRLVTAAAHTLAANTRDVSLTLLQAAYSHNGLAEDFDDKGRDGAFRALLADKRASGPVLITHTKNDRAIGIAYPLASRLSRDPASALGDENDPYGGMGRNGAQHTPEAKGLAGELQDVGGAYQFAASKVFNLRADRFIKEHSDVTGHQVAYALLHAVRAT